MNFERIRAEFPALANWTHLNTATFGQLPRRATEAMAAHLAHRDELACWDFLAWFDDMDRIRDVVGRLIACERADVAFIPNASVALGLLIAGIDWKPGDRVITLHDEFPNNLYAPAALARRGVEFAAVPWDAFYESVCDRTRLVIVSSVNYTTGWVAPLGEISAFLRRRGVLLFVDGTQSVGALDFQVGRVQPDMLAVHGYKWLNSPNGAGFMYVSPELRSRLEPNVIGWRSHRDWRNVDHLHHGAPELPDSAEKYEGGMLPFALLYAMEASIEMILEIGMQSVEHRVLELAAQTRLLAQEFGGEPVSENSPIVSVRFPGRDASALARALKEKRVLVAARHGLLRISTHFYNDERDLGRLRDALSEALSRQHALQ